MADQQWIPVDQVRQLAATYTEKAGRCQEIAQFIQDPLASMFWQSPAATQYSENMADYVELLRTFQDQFTQLSADLRQRADLADQSQGVRI